MISDLKKNIESEMALIKEINSAIISADSAIGNDKAMLEAMISSLVSKLKIINSAIPAIMQDVYPNVKLSGGLENTNKTERIENFDNPGMSVVLNKKDKDEFMKQHKLAKKLLRKIQKKIDNQEDDVQFKGARGYIKQSNRFFLKRSQQLIEKGYFRDLGKDIKKANLDILFASYVAMILFSSVISVIVGVFIAIFLMFFDISISYPFVMQYSGGIVSRLWVLLIPIIAPIATAAALYYYPSTERDSIEKRIDQELPFAVIHMSAISGSGIEPSEIFKIIGLSKEYPFLRKEIRKILNQINLYGYDLVTSLNYVSKNTPSKKLSELLAGLSTTISSGGDLSDFFEKRAETLLVGYRVDREKFTKLAETFMDIYISVVIAAPMILMLLLVMIQVSNINLGFSSTQIGIFIMLIIAILNVFFIGFLHIKQPTY